MARKIYGTIRDTNTGKGVKGLRVEAWDDDYPDGDDFMGSTTTDANGNYRISYSGGHWDPSVSHRVTIWRPDIYIRVLTRNATGQWVKLAKSGVHSDHKLENDLQIDLDVEIKKPVSKKTPFDPNQHGFHFANSFTVRPDILKGVDLRSWRMGFCGGMVAAALHRFKKGESLPADTHPLAPGTALYDGLLSRQIKTLMTPNIILDTIYDCQSAPDEGHWYRKHSVGSRTKREWWKLKNSLDNNKPAILVLIRVKGYSANRTRNHQVLATGYDYDPTTKDLTIQVYDPNHPHETRTLSMNIGLPKSRLGAKDSTRKRLRGVFVNPNGDAASS